MKPHEETWEFMGEGSRMFVVRAPDGTGDSSDIEVWPCGAGKDHAYDCARLAAQAPAMARLLLEHSAGWDSEYAVWRCLECGGFSEKYREDGSRPDWSEHATDCRLVAVLRAAGVIE